MMEKYNPRMHQIHLSKTASAICENDSAFIACDESMFYHKMFEITEQVLTNKHQIVLLTGPSSSGKTTASKILNRLLEQQARSVYRISLDNFYRNRSDLPLWQDGFVNYETIEGLDVAYFNELIYALTQKDVVQFPVFDFNIAKRSSKTFPISFGKDTVIIFEGIHALNPLLAQQFDNLSVLRLYISVHSDFVDEHHNTVLSARDLRLIRRTLRDETHRNASLVETLDMWDYVLRGEQEYIKPFRDSADIHIDSTHGYEPFVYRNDALAQCARFAHHKKHSATIERLQNAMQQFSPLAKQLVPDTSLIQEFLS